MKKKELLEWLKMRKNDILVLYNKKPDNFLVGKIQAFEEVERKIKKLTK